jgi:hypothetical protein
MPVLLLDYAPAVDALRNCCVLDALAVPVADQPAVLAAVAAGFPTAAAVAVCLSFAATWQQYSAVVVAAVFAAAALAAALVGDWLLLLFVLLLLVLLLLRPAGTAAVAQCLQELQQLPVLAAYCHQMRLSSLLSLQ